MSLLMTIKWLLGHKKYDNPPMTAVWVEGDQLPKWFPHLFWLKKDFKSVFIENFKCSSFTVFSQSIIQNK